MKSQTDRHKDNEEARKATENALKDLTTKVGAMKLELIEVSSRRDRSPPKLTRKTTNLNRRHHSKGLNDTSVDSKLTSRNRANTILPTGRQSGLSVR